MYMYVLDLVPGLKNPEITPGMAVQEKWGSESQRGAAPGASRAECCCSSACAACVRGYRVARSLLPGATTVTRARRRGGVGRRRSVGLNTMGRWVACGGPGSCVGEGGPSEEYWRYRTNCCFGMVFLAWLGPCTFITIALYVGHYSDANMWGAMCMTSVASIACIPAIFCCGARDENDAHYPRLYPVRAQQSGPGSSNHAPGRHSKWIACGGSGSLIHEGGPTAEYLRHRKNSGCCMLVMLQMMSLGLWYLLDQAYRMAEEDADIRCPYYERGCGYYDFMDDHLVFGIYPGTSNRDYALCGAGAIGVLVFLAVVFCGALDEPDTPYTTGSAAWFWLNVWPVRTKGSSANTEMLIPIHTTAPSSGDPPEHNTIGSAPRTLATSNFKITYDQTTVPDNPLKLGAALSELLKEYCRHQGILWGGGPGEEFFDNLNTEAMKNSHELADADSVPIAAQRMWTSTITLVHPDGSKKEFCSVLCAALRDDSPGLVEPAAVLTRAINQLCVTAGRASGPTVPDNYKCYRGGGFPRDKNVRNFFRRGVEFRQAAFLATSWDEDVTDTFLRRAVKSGNLDGVLWTIYIDRNDACQHVNLVENTHVQGETEYLFAPYSAFTVKNVTWSDGTYENPHRIDLFAAPDNKNEPEDLPLAPWS